MCTYANVPIPPMIYMQPSSVNTSGGANLSAKDPCQSQGSRCIQMMRRANVLGPRSSAGSLVASVVGAYVPFRRRIHARIELLVSYQDFRPP
jgi:hypothetical protein